MKKIFYIILGVVLFQGCIEKPSSWEFDSEIKLDNVKPIGVAIINDTLWVSDGEGNRVVQIDEKGNILKEKKSLERPMHIANFKNGLAIPEYGKDVITLLEKGNSKVLPTPELDAPAGIDFYKNAYAIADFYHHKIHFYNGSIWISFGEKGKGDAQFYYPTDVHIDEEYIYVADAYNHRIQIFNKQGDFVRMMADNHEINAATGIFSKDKSIFLADFENHRVLIFNNSGELKQTLTQNLSNPTDIIVFRDMLYVLNFKSGTISVYK